MKRVRNAGCSKHKIRYYKNKDYIHTRYCENVEYTNNIDDVRVVCPYCTRVILIEAKKDSYLCPTCNRKVKNTSKGRFKWILRNYLK